MVSIIESRTASEEQKLEVFDMVSKYGGFQHAHELAQHYNELTKLEIKKLHISDTYKQLLEQMSDFSTVTRKV